MIKKGHDARTTVRTSTDHTPHRRQRRSTVPGTYSQYERHDGDEKDMSYAHLIMMMFFNDRMMNDDDFEDELKELIDELEDEMIMDEDLEEMGMEYSE